MAGKKIINKVLLNRPCIPFVGAGIYAMYGQEIKGNDICPAGNYAQSVCSEKPGHCTAKNICHLKNYIEKKDPAEADTFEETIERITATKDAKTHEIYTELESPGALEGLQKAITKLSYLIYKLVTIFSSIITECEMRLKLLYIEDSCKYKILTENASKIKEILDSTKETIKDSSFGEVDQQLQSQAIFNAIQYLEEELSLTKDEIEGSICYGTYLFIIDLFWHTLRFEDRRHPYANELAFNIALENGSLPTCALELSQCAQCYDVRFGDEEDKVRTPEIIKNIMQYCATGDHSSCVLHECIAKYMHLLKYHSEMKIGSRNKKSTSDVINKSIGRLAVTTNYDNRLEECIAKEFGSCYVLFPVRDKHNDTEFKWCLHKRNSKEGSYENSTPVDYYAFDTFVHTVKFIEEQDSCLLLKIHGSPLYTIDTNKYEHFVVASEKGYLDSISTKAIDCSNIKTLIAAMYTTETSFAYIGYSVSDWNVRIAVYKQAVNPIDTPANPHRGSKQNPKPNNGFICVRSSNDYKHAIYKSLLIEPIETNFLELGKQMLSIAEAGAASEAYKNAQKTNSSLNSSAEEMQHV
jgi:hypothetical protein